MKAMTDFTTLPAGGGEAFPKTSWYTIRDSSDRDSPTCHASWEKLSVAYWRPVYAYIRRKWGRSNEEAKDLTQDFFVSLIEKEFLEGLSPERGTFRSYVRASLDNFVRQRHRFDSRQKRGGEARVFSFDMGEGFDPPSNETPEQTFLREWARSVLEESMRELEREYRAAGKDSAFEIFRLYDVARPPDADLSYEGLARRFESTVPAVTRSLYTARQDFRNKVRGKVLDTVSAKEDLEAEMRELFGGLSW